jgi:hypothetical protein
MNYIREINSFYDWLETNTLTYSAISLWHALVHIANKAGWPEEFAVAISTLESKTGLKKDAIIRARNRLRQVGRINFRSRTGRQSAIYQVISFEISVAKNDTIASFKKTQQDSVVLNDANEVYPTIDDAPYQEGDILWVRETWNYSPNWYYCYKADTIPDDNHGYIGSIPWRPSIHMPREAARLFLKVTSVKVERVQDITPKNIAAEGLPSFICHPEHEYYKNVCGDNWLGFEWFRELWDGINSKRGYGWDTNPWAWVIEFEKISKEEAERLEGRRG